ncbi:MAG: hypothetical protein A3I78_10775 [Gammaproteobacteria bacterium RIFCSPLOWO2_02_FULL_56_15]|nr:MAG: hypothetical protein A3I78_10775 [Gammaproteobacteria bacterium RIFCSPLOWO2_02_FULL_56_15]
MQIESLRIQNVRILDNIRITPGQTLNSIVGPNASGKTSFLEAIYILSRGRSFRTPRIHEVITNHKETLLVSAEGSNRNDRRMQTGIEKSRGRTCLKYNGFIVSKISQQAANLPVILITPESHSLVTGDPKRRRLWLDWALFHVEPSYLDHWRAYHRAYRQRNHLVQQGMKDSNQITGWERAMEQEATVITFLRKRFIEDLQGQFTLLAEETGPLQVQIELQQGWTDGTNLYEVLESSREADIQTGHTRHGIHRGDVVFKRDNRSMSRVCSRGEIKQFITILLIAQARLLSMRLGEYPLILFDDLASELDVNSRNLVITLLQGLHSQVFMTMTDIESTGTARVGEAVFHVEHGNIRKVVR